MTDVCSPYLPLGKAFLMVCTHIQLVYIFACLMQNMTGSH